MKKTKKIFVSITSLGVLLNNVAYATTEVIRGDEESFPTKYIFIGIAVVVIGLLLFLGYKMDTNEKSITRTSPKAKKEKSFSR